MEENYKQQQVAKLKNALWDIVESSAVLNDEIKDKYNNEIREGKKPDFEKIKERESENSEIAKIARELIHDPRLGNYETWGNVWEILNDLSAHTSLEDELAPVRKALSNEGHKFQDEDKKKAAGKIKELGKRIRKSNGGYLYEQAHYDHRYDQWGGRKDRLFGPNAAGLPYNNLEYLEEHYVNEMFMMPIGTSKIDVPNEVRNNPTYELDTAFRQCEESGIHVGINHLTKAKEYKQKERELRVAVEALEEVVRLCGANIIPGVFDKTKEAALAQIKVFRAEIHKMEQAYENEMAKYEADREKFFNRNPKAAETKEEKTENKNIIDKGIDALASKINIGGNNSNSKEEKIENKNIIDKGIDALASKINIGDNNSNSKEEPLTPEQLLDEIAMQQVIMEMKEQIGNITASDAKEELLELVNKTSDERALIRCHRQGYAKQYETLDAIPRQDYYSYIGATKNMYAEIDKKLDEYVAWVNRLENEKRLRELEYKEKIEPVEEPEREIKQPVQEVNKPKSPSFWSTFKDKVINGKLNINLNNIDPDNYNKGMGR